MTWMYYRYHHAGAIRISGKDRIAFLQALTTNDLRRLTPNQAIITVLTNAAGRILDVLTVLEDEDALLVLTLPGRAETTLQYLHTQLEDQSGTMPLASLRKASQRYDVALRDESRLWDQALLLPGDGAPPGGLEAPRHAGYAQRFPNGSAAVSMPPIFGQGLLLLNPKGVTVMVIARTHLLSHEAYTVERIRRGIPGAETELTAEFSPYEVGLGDFVALEKAEFPGRAMLAHEARNPSRARTLVGLRLAAPIELPASVRVEGKQIGRVTSTTVAPEIGPIALATVRRPYHTPGTRVTVHYYARGVQATEPRALVVPFPIGKTA